MWINCPRTEVQSFFFLSFFGVVHGCLVKEVTSCSGKDHWVTPRLSFWKMLGNINFWTGRTRKHFGGWNIRLSEKAKVEIRGVLSKGWTWQFMLCTLSNSLIGCGVSSINKITTPWWTFCSMPYMCPSLLLDFP